VFLLAGIVSIGIWAWSAGREAVYEDWSNWSFDRQVAGQHPTWKDYAKDRWRRLTKSEPAPQPEPSAGNETPAPGPAPSPAPPANNALIGRLSIPRLGVRSVVREGTGAGILSVAVGHIVGTALPGQPGNFAVAGHRDTLFRGLKDVRLGDEIEFETPDNGKYVYEVESTKIVSPDQVSVLKAGLHPELTLVTCYPFYFVGSAPYRFIVKARQLGVDEKPAERVVVAEKKAAPQPVHRRVAMKPMPYSSALVYRSYRR
jgi:sortase A